MSQRIAIFGQAAFGRDVTERIAKAGFEIAGVYVPPDGGGKPDPLAALANEHGWPLFRYARFRRKGEPIPELVTEYLGLSADLNVMPFTTVILPDAIVSAPRLGSLCFHPSILPAYRGGSAIPWQIILGANETGVTVFQPDEGVDTGPIVVQKRGIPIAATDTAASLYFDKLYPLGVEALLEAVQLVTSGRARPVPQSAQGASFQGLLNDEAARIHWDQPGEAIERLVRGCDPNPGAWCRWREQTLRLFGASWQLGGASAHPGSVLGESGGALRIALRGGELRVAKLRLGDGGKQPAQALVQSGLTTGERLA